MREVSEALPEEVEQALHSRHQPIEWHGQLLDEQFVHRLLHGACATQAHNTQPQSEAVALRGTRLAARQASRGAAIVNGKALRGELQLLAAIKVDRSHRAKLRALVAAHDAALADEPSLADDHAVGTSADIDGAEALQAVDVGLDDAIRRRGLLLALNDRQPRLPAVAVIRIDQLAHIVQALPAARDELGPHPLPQAVVAVRVALRALEREQLILQESATTHDALQLLQSATARATGEVHFVCAHLQVLRSNFDLPVESLQSQCPEQSGSVIS
mmetsp:Transcript_165498/g.531060  ORF Transcript_165498/g.531060 Transcript_165498/m.531060 type:complete len:273 (-) Transcript_165498:671-1489(-)